MKKTEKKEQKQDTKKRRLTKKTVVLATVILLVAAVLIITVVHIIGNSENVAMDNSTVTSGTLQEYRDTEDATDYMAEEVTQIEDSLSVIAISWTVPEGYMKTTGAFYVEAGGEISIAVNVTGDQEPVYVGIVAPDGTRRYVYAQGLVMHTFEVEESGYYQMYIRNTASGEIVAEGSVAYED